MYRNWFRRLRVRRGNIGTDTYSVFYMALDLVKKQIRISKKKYKKLF